jgi:pilus assembly protein TadC
MIALNKINKEEFGKLAMPNQIFSFKIRDELENIIEKVYFDNINYLKIANLFMLGQLVAFLIFVFFSQEILANSYMKSFSEAGTIVYFLGFFLVYTVLSMTTYYLFLFGYFFKINSKYKKAQDNIEKDLPEFIDALVSNLKGGISLERGLLKSVRKEQQDLLKEVTLINEKIMMGKTTLQALREFKDRYDSEILSRTIFLMEEGLRGGGNLSKPLERISQNLKRIYMLNDELKGSAGGFAIIIQAISIVVAPLLFALAITLLTFIGDLFALLADTQVSLFAASEIPDVYNTYLKNFSYAMIALITLFSSLITSSLKNEKSYEAIKYLPIYVAVALFLYSVLAELGVKFFSGIVG